MGVLCKPVHKQNLHKKTFQSSAVCRLVSNRFVFAAPGRNTLFYLAFFEIDTVRTGQAQKTLTADLDTVLPNPGSSTIMLNFTESTHLVMWELPME